MNVRLKYDMPFTAGIYYDHAVRMTNYNLRLWMATNTDISADQTVAFERIKYFVYTQMDSTIFINSNEHDQGRLFAEAGLNVTTLPGDPVDQLVGIMLYHKLNAIAENRMTVFETELSSTHGDGMTYLHCEDENTAGFVHPDWWSSPDLRHSDIDLAMSDKVVAITQTTPWRELELDWSNNTDQDDTGNIVVFADFVKQSDDTK
jgi:hypothetical protein